MRSYVITALILVSVSAARAQQDAEAQVEPSTARVVETNTTNVETNQPVVIVNQAQKAPIANDAQTEKLRQEREAQERVTEKKLSEKLEQSRLEDEKNRLNKLTGQPATPEAEPQIPPAQKPLDKTAPAVIAPIADKDKQKEDDVADADLLKHRKRVYVNGMLGLSQYPDARNVKGNYATGVSVGEIMPSQWQFEGFFSFANYDVDTSYSSSLYGPYLPWIKNLDQYSLGAVAKYRLFDSDFTPVIGGLGALVFRNYRDANNYKSISGQNADQQKESSQALDVGLLIGADYKISEHFVIGGDFRYMQNVTYKTSAPQAQDSFYYYSNDNTKPLEQINYYILSINAAYLF